MISSLADRLKTALKGPPKTTQKALADACGVSPPSVSDWLSGKSKTMEGSNLLAAAKLLQVNPTWLASGVGPMRSALKDWPFPDIERGRFEALTPNQKIEVQGVVRSLIGEFEATNAKRKSA